MRGTLARALVVRTTALVAVVAVLLSAFTALAMHRILQGQLDQQLTSASVRATGGGRGMGPGGPGQMGPGTMGPGGAGQAQGLLFYVQGSGGIVQVEREQRVLGPAVAAVLDDLRPTHEPVTRLLPGLGSYRLHASGEGGRVLVTGLPTAGVTASITALLVAAGLLTVAAIALAFLAARAVVERSLRPLQRLATTANQVSALELRSGEVAVPVRVPEPDADPRSEVGQVGLALNHMLDRVEDALAARQRSETKVRRFVADASHELRNPLASIRGYAELTRRGRDDLPPDTRHALARIESESERMAHLVDDLLLLARLDAGPALDLARVDLTDIVVNAVSDAQAAGPAHHWSVALPADGAEALVDGDRFRLHQVLANLLANARTHTPAGTHVTTTLALDGPDVVVSVADDGPGIPADLRERVFERFTRADAARARSDGTSSTGLGLAIVRAVVAAHGGTVLVANSCTGVGTPGHPGAAFTIRLPRAGAGGAD